jgi:hypothetical protein
MFYSKVATRGLDTWDSKHLCLRAFGASSEKPIILHGTWPYMVALRLNLGSQFMAFNHGELFCFV